MAIRIGGWAGWLAGKLRRDPQNEPRLVLIERIALAPRQALVLIEAEGTRFLVATSQEGAPSFYPLDRQGTSSISRSVRERGASA